MNSEVRKPGYHKIWQFLDDLQSQAWLGHRQAWLDHLYHFTHAENVAQILETGFLLSRKEARRQGKLKIDAASKKILSNSPWKLRDYVRLYFRPKTPTTYHMEGIKSKLCRKYPEAHCSIPVYLLFDSREILALNETRFSRGSPANYHEILKGSDKFPTLPFRGIYANYYEYLKSDDIDVRHAEVMYPKKLPLKYLRRILCRSQAEFDTLRNLCQRNNTWDRWKSRVKLCSSSNMFNRKWLFIDEVNPAQDLIQIRFHLPEPHEDKGPFEIVLRVSNRDKTYTLRRVVKVDNVFEEIQESVIGWKLAGNKSLQPYNFDVRIDGDLAYKGTFD